MFAEDCHDRLRCRLNDDDGVLRFVEFEVLNAWRCRGVETALQRYFAGRALGDVDLDYLGELTCTGKGECIHAVIREVNRYLGLFVRRDEDQAATC